MEENKSIVFTLSALLDLLTSIDELKDYDLGISEDPAGDIILQIGDSTYSINTDQATDVKVPAEVTDTVDEVNEQAYEDLADNLPEGQFQETDDTIEGGLLKEMLKSITVGGLVRLGAGLFHGNK